MSYDTTKLVYYKGEPQWLMPDGSFVPATSRNDGTFVSEGLYIKDRACDIPRLIHA